jgi:hypothetical protein
LLSGTPARCSFSPGAVTLSLSLLLSLKLTHTPSSSSPSGDAADALLAPPTTPSHVLFFSRSTDNTESRSVLLSLHRQHQVTVCSSLAEPESESPL